MKPDLGTSLRPDADPSAADHDRTAPRERPPEQLPEAFGRYRIVRKLGRGGMGSVYLADDPQLDRKVALKVPLLDPDAPGVLARFYREARAAATIDHPNVCPVYDVGEHAGVHFVAMAYIDGKPLSDLLRDGKPLPQRPAAAVVRKLAAALHEAHARGVIHRDLKPANVMINRRKEPVVVDFGLARRVDKDDRLTRDGAIVGTPAYMPPEQVTGDPDAVDARGDIYSLGVILYQMLTGRVPFEGTVFSVIAKLATEDPTPADRLRPDLDPPLAAVCRKAMARNPGDRFANMGEFAAALTAYLRGGTPAETGRPATAGATDPPSDDGKATDLLSRLLERLEAAGPASAVAPPPRSRSFLLPLIAGACLLLAGGAAVFFLTRPQQPPTVVVQLSGLAERVADPAIAVITLDGKEVTREQLAGSIPLSPGEHVLVTKRADGTVVGTYRFTVGQGDNGKAVAVTAEAPATVPPPATLEPTKITAKDIGNIAALDGDLSFGEAKYDPTARRVVFAAETKRAIGYAPADLQYQVRFYDAADARLATDPLRFQRAEDNKPIGPLKVGEGVRASFGWPRDGEVKRMRLVAHTSTALPAGDRPPLPAGDPAALPAGVSFDLSPLEKEFVVGKAEHLAYEKRVEVVLEARRKIGYAAAELVFEVHYLDENGTRVHTSQFRYTDSQDVLQGERVRGHLPWGTDATRKAKKVVLVPRK